ncbi:MAG: Na+/H+ antiporter NhaA [Alphaproteobacteria bacterium]
MRFINPQAAGGLVLMATAVFALVLDNSSFSHLYATLLKTPAMITIGDFKLAKPVLLWINDGLMAVFFFLVGMEIKREILVGQLSSRDRIMLPGIAAVGGMAVPAIIYAAINFGDPVLINGWAIPAATDIAFALGVLALLGNRVPPALKAFLLAVAILDDLGAIIIIAVFYTSELSFMALAGAGGACVVLAVMNRIGVGRVFPYIAVGLVLWVLVLKGGVHATLAGVALAMAIPLRDRRGKHLLEHLEHGLQPYVAFGVMPLFAFANAGVSLAGFTLGALLQPLPLAIALGLFFGKQIGVFGAVWLSVRSGICRPIPNTSWLQVYGLACLAGIGFTMSLFIGTLSFDAAQYAPGVRIGVLGGSLMSAIVGATVLYIAGSPSRRTRPVAEGRTPVAPDRPQPSAAE